MVLVLLQRKPYRLRFTIYILPTKSVFCAVAGAKIGGKASFVNS
jgi:hypothetical protein